MRKEGGAPLPSLPTHVTLAGCPRTALSGVPSSRSAWSQDADGDRGEGRDMEEMAPK